MGAETSGSFDKGAIQQNSSRGIPTPTKNLILCGIMGRTMYAESGAGMHIGFNLVLVTRLFTPF